MQQIYEYGLIPFYFINDDIEREEIVRQLDILEDKNISGFFLHVRDGILNQAYGTNNFFQDVKFIVEQAKIRGIKVWLYDEDAYPSGNYGGKLLIDKPELAAYSLNIKKIDCKAGGRITETLGKVKGLYAYAITDADGKKKCVKFSDCFGPIRKTWYKTHAEKAYYFDMEDKIFPHIRAATCYSEIALDVTVPENSVVFVVYLKQVHTDLRFGTQCDLLNAKTTEEFIKRVHEKYKEFVGEYFGSEIVGLFTDEPCSGGYIPYTDELPKFFEKKYGYSIEDNYYKLSSEYDGDFERVRRDYYACVNDLFCKNYLEPVSEWCKKNGLLFTGHYICEENFLWQTMSGQFVYKNVGYMDIPGFDIIGNNLGDVKHPGLISGTRQVVSKALQTGKERVLAECFALNPYNFGYNGLKRITDWLFACGINLLVPHGFHYAYSAFQRADAGKTFFFQDGLFDEYLKYSEYEKRLCKKIVCFDKEKCDVLLLLPFEEICGYNETLIKSSLTENNKRNLGIIEKFQKTVSYLISHQITWHVVDRETLNGASFKNGKIILGDYGYGTLLVVEDEGDAIADKYSKTGVNVRKYDDEMNFLRDINGLSLTGERENILALAKTNGKNDMIFLFNNGEDFAEFSVDCNGETDVYDVENDMYYKTKISDGKLNVTLNAYESLLLVTGDNGAKGYYVPATKKENCHEYLTKPELTYLPHGGAYSITDYTLKVSGKKHLIIENTKFTNLRDVLGTNDDIYKGEYRIPHFDKAKRNESVYPVKAVYESAVEYRDTYGKIVFDKGTLSGEYDILWNGKSVKGELKKDFVYDVSNLSFNPVWKNGKNTLTVIFEKAGEFDGINGEITIMKK